MENYEIVIESHVDEKRHRMFEGLELRHLPNGRTLLSGMLSDQAALFAVLSKIRDMNLSLVLVRKNNETLEENKMKRFIQNRTNLFYFLFTFGWTWILVFGLIFSGAVKDVSKPTPAFILVGLLCGISPSLASILIARAKGGKAGLTALFAQFKQKSPKRMLALTLLTVLVVTVITIFVSNYAIRSYQFALTIPLIFVGLIWPLFSGFGEEFGWRGFILPQLLKKYTPLTASILLGLVWALWHIPMDYIAYKDYGVYLIPAYLLTDFIVLTVHAIIMTYIYRRSNGNLKLMVLYHYTITASAIIPGAFFKTVSLPQYTVWEAVVSVSLFFLLAVMLSVKDYNDRKALQNG